MTKERFWVVGGDYTCMGFKALKDGQATVVGPFEDRDEAKAEWQRLSEETRSRATARFTIAAEKLETAA
jgi:hypothetical protein